MRGSWLLPLSLCTLLCLAIIVFLELSSGGRGRNYTPQAVIDLESKDDTSQIIDPCKGEGEKCLRVAIAPVISPEKSIEAYYELVKYLGAKTGRKTKLLTGKDYIAVNNLVRYNQCDVALVCTYSYVLGAERGDMQLLAIPRVFGENSYHSYIIARKGSGFSSLADLKGKVFASSDVLSTSGWLYPMTWLKEQGIEVENFFGQHVISGSHDRSIQAVDNGIVDAAAVDSLVYRQALLEHPSLTNRIEIIQTSEPFGMPPVVVSSSFPMEERNRVQQALITMHENERGRAILKKLSIERFSPADPTAYASVRQLISKWEAD